MPFDDNLKIRIQESTDIVDLISEQTLLKQKGREFAGLCPFHDDKNPSMSVSPTKQIYKCFSCGAGGDVYSWMMNYHKMDFVEAMKFLAERAHIEWPKDQTSGNRDQGSGPSDRELIAEANDKALRFFRGLLQHEKHGAIARKYIEERGISDEMLEAFQVGYAPDRWDGLALTINDKGWNAKGFERAGLINIRKGDDSSNPKSEIQNPKSYYDRMRHRLMFPIFDPLGRPIAFGGRILPGGTRDDSSSDAKYLNSPETALFNKSQTLYGLHLAKKPIIDSRTAVIVEGYTDVIGCHQAGADNVVATLGTALTAQHVKVLKRYCEKVVLVFDPDEAGQKAADRAVEIFLTEEADVYIAVLPQGTDPADLMNQSDGFEQWKQLLGSATDAMTYQFSRVNERLDGSDTVTGRQRVAEEFVQKLAALGLSNIGAIRRSMIVQRLGMLLHLPEDAINGLLRRHAPRRRGSQTNGQNEEQYARQYGSQASGQVPFSGSDSSGNTRDFPPDSYNEPPNGVNNTENSLKSSKTALPDVASLQNGNRINLERLERAERQLVGCLLKRPGLFAAATLSNGLTLDEALTPGDLVTPNGQALYGRLYHSLADGEEVTLGRVLAALAEDGEVILANLATQTVVEIDQMTESNSRQDGGDENGQSSRANASDSTTASSTDIETLLQVKLTSAAQVILDHHRTSEYLLTRTAATQSEQEAPNDALKQVFEYNKANPSPLKIMRRD